MEFERKRLQFTCVLSGNRLPAFTCLFFLFLRTLVFSQGDTYTPLVSRGTVPKDFLTEYNNKDNDKLFFHTPRNEIFYQQNAFFLNRLLTSGKVLFGDTTTVYLNHLADIILKDRPELRKDLRFYAAKIPSTNAYCADNGIVLVNIGLMAQVENEAQLAFILCHEISHYVAKHPLTRYLDNQLNHRPEELLLSQTLYSQQIELEADSMGLLLYLGTPFAPKECLSAFAVSEFPDIIFPDISIQSEWLKASAVSPMPQTKVLSATTLARQAHLSGALPAKSAKVATMISPATFHYIQKICRFEMCRYQVERQMYEQALFNALSLQQWYHTDDDYLNKVIIYSAYALCKYINAGRFWEIHHDYTNSANCFAQLCAYFELEPRLTLHLAVIQKINSLQNQKELPFWELVKKDLYQEIGKQYVSNINPDGSIVFTNETGLTEAQTLPDSTFDELIRSAFFARKQQSTAVTKETLSESKRQKNWLFKGFNLGIDTLVFVEPSYQRIDLRHEKTEEIEVSTAMQIGLIQKIKEYSAAQNLHAYLLHSSELQPGRVDYFNRLCLLNDWMTEKSAFKELDMQTFCHDEVQTLVERYNTPYFAWMGGRHIIHKRKWKPSLKIQNMLSFPFLSVNSETFFYVFVYNLETEKYSVLYPRYVSMKDRADVFHSIIYDMIFQITHKAKQ